MDKNVIKEIKKLKEEKCYDQIYYKFGQKAYGKYVPSKYKKNDLNKLKKERRYEDIYNKYGTREYNKILTKAMYEEIKEAKGFGSAISWRAKQAIKNIGVFSAFSLFGISGLLPMANDMEKYVNSIKYESEIEEYDKNISKYAEEVKSMNLSDVQVFMKVMDDMWENIQGYKAPENEIRGFLELNVATSDGYGVCRNFASDIEKKLNKIDPKYNARTLCVKTGDDGNYYIANIERKLLEINETTFDDELNSEEQVENNSKLQEAIIEALPDHLVTLVDVDEYNATFVLDPTNPGIGVYKDGNIYMFNSDKENGWGFEPRKYYDSVMEKSGIDEAFDVVKDYIKSYEELDGTTMTELEEIFGLEAQNKALEEVRAIKKMSVAKETDVKEQLKELVADNELIVEDINESLDIDENDKGQIKKEDEEIVR